MLSDTTQCHQLLRAPWAQVGSFPHPAWLSTGGTNSSGLVVEAVGFEDDVALVPYVAPGRCHGTKASVRQRMPCFHGHLFNSGWFSGDTIIQVCLLTEGRCFWGCCVCVGPSLLSFPEGQVSLPPTCRQTQRVELAEAGDVCLHVFIFSFLLKQRCCGG